VDIYFKRRKNFVIRREGFFVFGVNERKIPIFYKFFHSFFLFCSLIFINNPKKKPDILRDALKNNRFIGEPK